MKHLHRIAVIPGDGIGPEVIDAGLQVLTAVSKQSGFEIEFVKFPWGGEHYLATGEALSDEDAAHLKTFSAIYLGAIGDPRVPIGLLERAILLRLRKELDLYVNLRPLKLYHPDYSPLKNSSYIDYEVCELSGSLLAGYEQTKSKRFRKKTRYYIDILVVRENTEDLYTGPSGTIKKDTLDEVRFGMAFYSRKGVERIIRYAFDAAKGRRKKVTLCDKANAVCAQEIWREVFGEIGKEYPDIAREEIYVDACAMAFVRRPQDFDVVVTTNLFGDILSDLGSELCGGIGLAPSANIHPGKSGLFEPIHGSAPKYAGKNQANPIGAILSGAMMLDFLGEKSGADCIQKAVSQVLAQKNLVSGGSGESLGTTQIRDLVLDNLPLVVYNKPLLQY